MLRGIFVHGKKKSQNCVKAAIAFVCTTCKRHYIITYRAAPTAKNAKHKCKMKNIKTDCSNIIYYKKGNYNRKLTIA